MLWDLYLEAVHLVLGASPRSHACWRVGIWLFYSSPSLIFTKESQGGSSKKEKWRSIYQEQHLGKLPFQIAHHPLGFGFENAVIQDWVHRYFQDGLTPCFPRSSLVSVSERVLPRNSSNILAQWTAQVNYWKCRLMSLVPIGSKSQSVSSRIVVFCRIGADDFTIQSWYEFLCWIEKWF